MRTTTVYLCAALMASGCAVPKRSERASAADGSMPSPAPRVVELSQMVRALGRKGADAERVDVRADLYGDLLTTCAECHQWLGGGPTPAEPPVNR